MTTLLVSAGDASGEIHAAALIRDLRSRDPELRILGLGGPEMEKAGAELVVHQSEIAVGGLVEVLGDLGRIVSAWRRLGAAMREAKPDLVILVDAPDFNIPFARRAQKAGIPVLYYISPQVWAWRRGRIRKIARRVDRMAVIFPFETDVYAGTGLPVEFVGHPLVDRLRPLLGEGAKQAARTALGVGADERLVALLPGSRRNEVRDTLPLQLDAAVAVHARDPRVRFTIAVAPSIPAATVQALVASADLPGAMRVDVLEGRTYDVVRAADVALAKPGTSTVEIALLGTPLVVAARVHPLTAFIMRRVVRVPSFTMPNLIAGEALVPEFLQEDAQPEPLADALLERIEGPERDAQLAGMAEVRRRLGDGGAAARTATIVQEMTGA